MYTDWHCKSVALSLCCRYGGIEAYLSGQLASFDALMLLDGLSGRKNHH